MRLRRISYSVEELAFLEAMALLPRELAHAEFVQAFARADVSVDNIRAVYKRHGWTTRVRWTEAEDAVLRAHYADTRSEELAKRLGRPLSAVYQRAYGLGLAKTPEYLAQAGRILKGERRGTATEFRPGVAPANKGVKRGRGWAPGRMATTQFRPGVPSWRNQPVGSTRVVDGYEYTKIRDTPCVAWTKNWKVTHWLRWEALHGPIPKGHALKCLDGNRLNTDPANWTLVDRALLPRLNGGRGGRMQFDSAPAELKPVLLTVARLEHAARTRRGRA